MSTTLQHRPSPSTTVVIVGDDNEKNEPADDGSRREIRTSTCMRITLGVLVVLALALVIMAGMLLSETSELQSDIEQSLRNARNNDRHGEAAREYHQRLAARDFSDRLHAMVYHNDNADVPDVAHEVVVLKKAFAKLQNEHDTRHRTKRSDDGE